MLIMKKRDGIKLLQNNVITIASDFPDAHYFLARTKDFLDYIPADNLNYIFGETDYNGDIFDMPRRNKDMLRFNLFGKSLASFCSTFDMHILNGRVHNDGVSC